MTEAIIWLVVWAVLAFAGAWLIAFALGVGGVALAAATDKVWIGGVGAVLAWVGAVGWFIFAAVQVVMQIVSVIGFASAGA